MELTFSPTRHNEQLSLSRTNDVLTINGEDFDFSALPEGATLPREAVASPFVTSEVTRINGDLHLTILLPHGANAPQETLFPEPITVTQDGPIELPAYATLSVMGSVDGNEWHELEPEE